MQKQLERVNNKVIRLLSYNVKLLPIEPDKDERASKIEKQFAAYDIVCLQEAFDESLRDDLADYASKYAGLTQRAEGPDSDFWAGHFVGSGLYVMTHYKIDKRYKAEFPMHTEVGMDAMASKGVVYARLVISETQKLHVFVAHTQSGSTRGRRQGRWEQLIQMAEFINQQAELDGHPVLLFGDLNVDAHDEDDYRRLVNILEKNNTERTLHDLVARQYKDKTKSTVSFPGSGELLDYAFLFEEKKKKKQRRQCRFRVQFMYWDTSDHAALDLKLTFK